MMLPLIYNTLIACSNFLSPQIIPYDGIKVNGGEPWLSSGDWCYSNLSIIPSNEIWLDNERYYFNRSNLGWYWDSTLHVYRANGSFEMDYTVSWLDTDWIMLYTCNSTSNDGKADIFGFNGANFTQRRPYIKTLLELQGLSIDDFDECNNMNSSTTSSTSSEAPTTTPTPTTEEPTTTTELPTTVTIPTTEESTTTTTELPTTVTDEPTTVTTEAPTTVTDAPTEPPRKLRRKWRSIE
jgi:hypothetical protein